jgi:hypothetical protein
MAEVLNAFRSALAGRAAQVDGDCCNGFWHGWPGLELIRKTA